jgi:hypothetical protein
VWAANISTFVADDNSVIDFTVLVLGVPVSPKQSISVGRYEDAKKRMRKQ